MLRAVNHTGTETHVCPASCCTGPAGQLGHAHAGRPQQQLGAGQQPGVPQNQPQSQPVPAQPLQAPDSGELVRLRQQLQEAQER